MGPRTAPARWPAVLAVIIVIAGLSASAAAASVASRSRADQVETAFDTRTTAIGERLSTEIGRYEVAVAALGGFVTVAGVDPSGIKSFMQTIAQPDPVFPAAIGLTFLESVTEAERAAFEARAREEGYPGFTVAATPPRPEYAPFLFSLPASSTLPAPGTDALTTPGLLEAMYRARAMGRSVMSSTPLLVNESGMETAVSIVTPVLSTDGAATLGWAVAFIDMNELLGSAIGVDEHIAVELNAVGGSAIIAAVGKPGEGEPTGTEVATYLGDDFRLGYAGETGFSRSATAVLPPLTVFALGAMLTLLLAVGTWLLTSTLDRNRRAKTITHLATHDALTELPNRELLMGRLTAALAGGQRGGETTAVLFVDLDRFKIVNNTLGHDAGDAVLIEVTARLQSIVRPGDVVARVGGDEFVVVAERLSGDDRAVMIGQRIVVELGRPIETSGGAVRVGASVGIAIAPTDSVDEDELVRFAESAMHRAKADGQGRAVRFDHTVRDRVVARRDTEQALARAVTEGQLEAFFQPFVALDDGAVVAYEALVRWQHPERGLLTPAEFLPDAESNGTIVDIDRWMCRESVRRASNWAADGFGAVTVWVNASVRSLVQADFAATVRDALEEYHLDASRLGIEVDETVLDIDPEIAARALGPIRELGVRVALDDFGGGSSSLAVLRRVPIDLLKLDRSLVEPLGTGPEPETLVAAVVGMAHSLGITVIAEGIETVEQLDATRRCGCDLAQGYLYARPQPIDEVNRARRRGTPAALEFPR